MKTLVTLILCSLAVLLPACSDDSGSGLDETEETPLASATIGTGGGELVHDDFTLVVPEGAFTASASIELYELDEGDGFGDNAISPLYRLDGLPDSFGESLYVAVRYNGELSGESYIAYGRETQSVEGGHLRTVYALDPATDSSGFLVARIPPRNDSESRISGSVAKTSADKNRDYITGFIGKEAVYQSPLFSIYYPFGQLWIVDDLTSYLETAHNIIVGMGLRYELREWRWPGQLVMMDMEPTKWNPDRDDIELELDIAGKKPPVLNLDDWWTEPYLPHLRRRLGVEMMAIAQSDADPGGWRCWDSANYKWHVAVRQWFEEKVSDPASFDRPSHFPTHEITPFNGLKPGMDGHGMSPLVKHLAETEGDEVIGRIYEYIYDGQMFVDAILNSTAAPVYNWLPAFFDRYVTGQYYYVSASTLMEHTTSTFTIDSDDDTLGTFYHGCPQLGAQIYRVALADTGISANARLSLTLTGAGINPDYLTVLLYKYKDHVLTYLDAGHDLSVSDLRALTHDGYDLVAVVVNSFGETPYTGTSTLTLTMRVTAPHQLDYNTARIRLNDITYDCYEEWQDTDTTFQQHHGGEWRVTGQFTGNTFTGLRATQEGDWICTVFVSITVDPITLQLTDFNAYDRCGKPTYKQSRSIQSVPGMSLPFMEGWSDLNWQVTGTSNVCDYFSYESVIQGFPPQYDHWYQRCVEGVCVADDPEIWISLTNETQPGDQ